MMKFTLPNKFTMPKMPSTQSLPSAFQLDLRSGEISRYFSGSVFEKALLSMDKVTLWVVGITWIVALVAMGGAYMAVKSAASLKLQADAARAQEPPVPRIIRAPLSKEQYDPLLARLTKQYPGLRYDITGKPSLRIASSNGDAFNVWLSAIGYTDSMLPSVRWNLVFFCAGAECPGDGLMQAELVAENISISQPEGDLAPATPAAK
jgi:hypothetical protein